MDQRFFVKFARNFILSLIETLFVNTSPFEPLKCGLFGRIRRIEAAADIEQGMLGVEKTEDGELRIAEDDIWMIETFGEMRRLGFTRELGFTVADVAFYEEAMSRLFREEMRLLSRRLSHLPPDEAAPMIERALPVIHTFLTRYHAQRVRDFFGSL